MRSGRVLFSVLLAAGLLAGPSGLPTEAGRAGDVRRQAFELINEGVTAYKNGDYESAVAKLRQASSMALNNFRAHFYLGLALIGDRRYDEAIEALDVALELDPNHLPSLVAVGDAYLKLGDLDEAQAGYFRALKIRPEYAAALDGLARIQESRAEDEQAIATYRRAIASNQGFAPAYTHLGDLYLRLGRFEDAVELLEEAVSVRPDFADGMNRLSLAYGRLGLINEAIATIQKALQLEPKNAAHPATLGELALEQGSLSAAEAAFHSSLELDPGQPVALRGLAEVARRRGDYDRAIELCDRALSDPRIDALQSARVASYRARVVEQQALFERLQALEAAEQAGSAEHAALARIYADRGQWDHAAEHQRRVDADPAARDLLAYLLFRASRFREAHEIYAALLAETGSADAAVSDGATLALLGDDRQAVERYRQALAIEPGHRTATLFLGNALLRLGDHDEAVAAYKTYLSDAGRGERAERVRRILAQVAPEALPAERPTGDVPPPPPSAAPVANDEADAASEGGRR